MFIAVKMVLVFALLGGTLWYLRRHDRSALVSARRTERPVAVLAQAKLGKSSSVALVRIGTEAYAVGVTEQNVTLLVGTPVDIPDTAAGTATGTTGGPATTPTATLGSALRGLLGRRSRVEYLDVALSVPTPRQTRRDAPRPGTTPDGADGSGSDRHARTPEPVTRR